MFTKVIEERDYMKGVDVSVIIPVFNKADYVTECLKSIIVQTKQEIEIVCVDDCSTDQSVAIIEDFMNRDNRIRLIKNKKNMGAGESRNIGLDCTIGEYVIFLDADDFFDVDLIKYMYEECSKKQLDLLHCGVFFCDQSLKNGYLVQSSSSSFSDFKSKVVRGSDLLDIVMYMIVCPYSNLIRKRFISDNGIRFQNLANNNDAYFAKMCYLLAERLEISDKVFVHCRKNIKGQLSAQKGLYPHNYSLTRHEIYLQSFRRGLYEKISHGLNTYWATGMINYFNDLDCSEKRATMEIIKKDIEDLIEGDDERFEFNNSYQANYLMDFLRCEEPEKIDDLYEYCMRFEVDKRNDLINYVDNNNLHVVIWGYSKYGRKLKQALNNYGISVKAIVDINYSRISESNVKSPDKIKEDKCFVISSNAHTFDGISDSVRKMNKESVTFDFMSCFTFGLDFHKCLR